MWRTARTITRFAFYGGCVLLVLFALGLPYLFDPFGGWAGRVELDAVAGTVARDQLNAWPPAVAPGDVENVTCKLQSTIDSHSSWYRLQLTPDAAASWMNSVHAAEESESHEKQGDHIEGVEGVHRMIPGPPPLHRQTGETPDWWTPPEVEFRATEVMVWYRNYSSGVGRATYSAFDESSGVLWIYEYGAQHDLLWTRGQPPAGDRFPDTE